MKKNIKIIFSISAIFCLLLTGCGDSKEKKAALSEFNAEVTRIEEQNTERDTIVLAAEALITTGKLALDETLLAKLQTAIQNAKAITFDVPKTPSNIDEIKNVTEDLKDIDNSTLINEVTTAKNNLEKSIKQYELVTAPTELYVIEKLNTVTQISGTAAVTEDNDPNGNLNKPGGYIASIYFSSSLVDQNKVDGSSIIDKGTSCGGDIEVYATAEDANKRNTYLAAFDGTIFASGSHTVIGTVVVRTSNLLKGSQQKELEANIISALTALPE